MTKNNLFGYQAGIVKVIGNFPIRKKYRNYWQCQCLCGTVFEVLERILLKSNIYSCGCRYKPLLKKGDRFGIIEIMSFDRYDQEYYWNCKCKCGKLFTKKESHIRKVAKQSCPCENCIQIEKNYKLEQKKLIKQKKQIDFINKYLNKTFNMLTIVEFIDDKSTSKKWKCICECGNYTLLPLDKILSGHTRSCGCLWRKTITKHGKCGTKNYINFLRESDPLRRIKVNIGNRIREIFKHKKINKGGKTFDYLPYTPQQLKEHLESLWEPWMNWNNYGGRLNDKRHTWHIDHIIPQVNFKFTSLKDKEFQECWALSNLRPLEKKANNIKRCSII